MKIQSRIFYLLLILMTIQTCKSEEKLQFHLPGEWEAQEAIWLGWESKDWVSPYNETVLELIEILEKNVQVKLVFPNDSLRGIGKLAIQGNNIDTTNIEFLIIPHSRYWMRDSGPTYIKNEKGEIRGVNFGWSRHGDETGIVDSIAYSVENIKIIKSDLINEGGGIESNGKGTLLLVESWIKDRNPGKSKEEIEKIYREAVGAENFIWLPSGIANDPNGVKHIINGIYGCGVGGHVDEFARFVNENTVLLAWVEESEIETHPINKLNYDILKEAFRILSNSKDQDGKPLRVIKTPLPDPIIKKVRVLENSTFMTDSTLDISGFKGDVIPVVNDTIQLIAAASYHNFLITNGLVLLPTYVSSGSSIEKEEKVKQIFSEIFPDRKQIFINVMYQNFRGGGIHCSTKQQPIR